MLAGERRPELDLGATDRKKPHPSYAPWWGEAFTVDNPDPLAKAGGFFIADAQRREEPLGDHLAADYLVQNHERFHGDDVADAAYSRRQGACSITGRFFQALKIMCLRMQRVLTVAKPRNKLHFVTVLWDRHFLLLWSLSSRYRVRARI